MLVCVQWHISHRAWNRLMHALHGNTTSSPSLPETLVKRVYHHDCPRLEGSDISLEAFLSWSIDAQGYFDLIGLTDYTCGKLPDLSRTASDAEKAAHTRYRREGLRYLCAMIGDKNLRTSVTMNAKSCGVAAWKYLEAEFLRQHSAQSALSLIHI